MCGIVGIASTRSSIAERGVLGRACDTLRHRGPDDAGEWWSDDGRVGLGHRRLSIIDLSPAGHQPMHGGSGQLSIVFNGEIYNFVELRAQLAAKGHAFRSQTDTEVILAAYQEWGSGCIARFNGMFAYALYDARAQTLLLARDRGGEKPLFYAFDGATLGFASELKALIAVRRLPAKIEPRALDAYLAMGFVPGELCILEGVNKLPPAHALTLDLRTAQLKVWRYWELPQPPASSRPAEELLGELETLLQDAVRRQLVADVPVGVLLSGGVDSSLVTAMAVRSNANVRTFTIRFPGFGSYDETTHARLIAGHFGTQHTEMDAGECTVDLLPVLARQFDEPLVDSSMIPTHLVSGLVRRHCTVALGGDGGDELFGGYIHYNRLLWVQKNLGWIPHPLRAACARLGERLLPVGFKGRNWLQSLDVDLRQGLPLIASYFDAEARRGLLGEPVGSPSAEAIRAARMPASHDLLDRATRMDFHNYLPEDILVKLDRASMLNSLEVRAPLLDYRLIEFAFGKVPAHLKATASSRKILLKKLAARILPKSFDLERKQGFSVPLASWLRSAPWQGYFEQTLLEGGFFRRGFVAGLLDGQRNGRANSERLFGLVMFELWRREYGATL